MNLSRIFILILSIFPFFAKGQDDLLEQLNTMMPEKNITVQSTFKGSRLINGHSVEMRSGGVLEFLISHRFGRLNEGAYQLFGLDDSNIRLGLEYGLLDRLNIGIGRSSFQKTYDGFIKYKLLQQTHGPGSMPISLAGFSSLNINTLRPFAGETISFTERLAYTHQLLLARKLSDKISLQLMPTLIHFNRVPLIADNNTIYTLGGGGRIKLTPSTALNLEYYHQFNPLASGDPQNVLAIGFDIETGGHVFQLHLTNSRAMIEPAFIGLTNGRFFEGDIHFGFNISRVFQLGQ